MATISSIHLHQRRLTTLHISNLHLSWNLCPFLCSSVRGSRCYVDEQVVKETTPDCFWGCFCSQLWAHFYARCILACSAIAHLSLCNYDQREELPEWSIRTSATMQIADQDVSTSPGSASCVIVEDHNSHIYRQGHRCEPALLKSAELSSIRFIYCKGSRWFKDI